MAFLIYLDLATLVSVYVCVSSHCVTMYFFRSCFFWKNPRRWGWWCCCWTGCKPHLITTFTIVPKKKLLHLKRFSVCWKTYNFQLNLRNPGIEENLKGPDNDVIFVIKWKIPVMTLSRNVTCCFWLRIKLTRFKIISEYQSFVR